MVPAKEPRHRVARHELMQSRLANGDETSGIGGVVVDEPAPEIERCPWGRSIVAARLNRLKPGVDARLRLVSLSKEKLYVKSVTTTVSEGKTW